jgi:HlyD family secretion protein
MPGILDEVYVRNGDTADVGQALARIGSEVVTAKIAGLIIDVSNTPGQVFSPSQPVVKMIDPNELRVVGTIKENEGLSDIRVGQPVSFTVDAFDGQTFTGIVEEISPTSRESGLTFSISDKREIKEFEVRVKYDNAAHPEFKNGMSAKMKVYRE